MIINNRNNKAEKRKVTAKDYLQRQLDMIVAQKKKKAQQLADLTAKFKNKEREQGKCKKKELIYGQKIMIIILLSTNQRQILSMGSP